MKLRPDLLEAKHWIYPLNRPKRDYQFNIVKNCLFENTLVALPTGLGKTFIAGVVMLNYYRWFPTGKVVFVAPTKPLVSQQITACHKVCGIPGTEAVELTGDVPSHIRKKYWQEKRVFYMTPQTLVNDIISENCEASEIILLVIDEAHRATGGYAYNQAMRFLMPKNPHFRTLALTATPGSNPEALQDLIDGLHISHVEIRDEGCLDIVRYIHEKKTEQHIITMNEQINRVKDILVDMMNPLLQKMKQTGILYSGDPVRIHHYMPQAKSRSLQAHERWAAQSLSRLSQLARAMGYLLEGTMGLCHSYLVQLSKIGESQAVIEHSGGESGSLRRKIIGVPKQFKSKIQWRKDKKFMALLTEIENQRTDGRFALHPKMELLRDLLINYFGQKMPDEAVDDEEIGASSAMVFATSREVVDEIVEMLEAHRPLIRASKFVGQGLDKQGRRGMAQKLQLETIQKFQANELNVLVSTSIGEEGLDIGEIDFIVCYDAQKTPIRMLQRFGRTGRQRDGMIHVLLAEHREEFNMEKAKTAYKEVQRAIWRGSNIELYGDVERLLPEHIKPQCLEKEMPIVPYVREVPYSKKSTNVASKGKRKRNDDVRRNIPTGAITGFVRASNLTVKGVKKRKANEFQPVKEEEDFNMRGLDDDTDKELESGTIMAPPRRTKSAAASTSKPKTERKPRLRKAATCDGGSKKRTSKDVEPTLNVFSQLGVDDSDDLDIEQTTLLLPGSKTRTKIPSETEGPSPTNSTRENSKRSKAVKKSQPMTSPANSVINITDSEHEPAINQATLSSRPPMSQYINDDLSWLVENDDEMEVHIASSPLAARNKARLSHEIIELDESVQAVSPSELSPGRATNANVEDKSKEGLRVSGLASPGHPLISSPLPEQDGMSGRNIMPSPDLPVRNIVCSSPDLPTSTLPVKRVRKARNKDFLFDSDGELSQGEGLKRLYRHLDSSTPVRRKKQKMTALEAQHYPLFDVVADHSGDEVSEGASNGEDDVESESDRAFIKNSPLTQVAGSYNQDMIYRQSLLTQARPEIDMPEFARAPVRRDLYGQGRGRKIFDMSSSPARGESGSDEYEFGSFVVRDEAEISYEA
ncbi:hypothetical protein AX15_005675 [Amanita polypyramis BW_CC]|nr:hypothetical protein AX15_005675 [Amanita polypyramis BW_CC]